MSDPLVDSQGRRNRRSFQRRQEYQHKIVKFSCYLRNNERSIADYFSCGTKELSWRMQKQEKGSRSCPVTSNVQTPRDYEAIKVVLPEQIDGRQTASYMCYCIAYGTNTCFWYIELFIYTKQHNAQDIFHGMLTGWGSATSSLKNKINFMVSSCIKHPSPNTTGWKLIDIQGEHIWIYYGIYMNIRPTTLCRIIACAFTLCLPYRFLRINRSCTKNTPLPLPLLALLFIAGDETRRQEPLQPNTIKKSLFSAGKAFHKIWSRCGSFPLMRLSVIGLVGPTNTANW